jgi:hypothetical protein
MCMKHRTLLTIDQLLSTTIVLMYYKVTITNIPAILYRHIGEGLVALWVQSCDPSPIPTIIKEKFILMANLHMVQSLSQSLLECKHNFGIIGLN